MTSIREILEEKTVEELRQMARDKNLSGYSNVRKDELIDLVEEGYTEEEIRSWNVGGGKDSLGKKIESNLWKLAIIGGAIGILIGFTGAYVFTSSSSSDEWEKSEFVSENYEFSFEYPSEWSVKAQSFENTRWENYYGYMRVALSENVPENEVEWSVMMTVDKRRGMSLDNVREMALSGSENILNQENVKISGVESFDISIKGTQENQGDYRLRGIFSVKDDYIYQFTYFVYENSYEEYEERVNSVLDSFRFLEE